MISSQTPFILRLRGQSNAAGEGLVSALPVELTGKLNCRTFNNITNTWQYLEAGVNSYNADTPFYTLNGLAVNSWAHKHGIELQLMKRLSDYYQSTMTLLKYGWSGSAIQTVSSNGIWNPSNVSANSCFLYSKNKEILAASNSGLISNIPNCTVWIQGESDNVNYSSYGSALRNYILAERTMDSNNPNSHFFIVSLSDYQTVINSTNLQGIKTGQRAVASKIWLNGLPVDNGGELALSRVHYIEQNITTNPDNLHYGTSSLITMANLIADTIIKAKII